MPRLKLYRIEQTVVQEYDTYDSAVVVASSPEQAATIHPREASMYDGKGRFIATGIQTIPDCADSTWAPNPEQVTVTLLGIADAKYDRPAVICASFNAG